MMTDETIRNKPNIILSISFSCRPCFGCGFLIQITNLGTSKERKGVMNRIMEIRGRCSLSTS